MTLAPDQILMLASGGLAAVVGLVSHARPRGLGMRTGRAGAVLLGALGCVSCGAMTIAADPATLAATPVVLIIALGTLEAVFAGITVAAAAWRITARRTPAQRFFSHPAQTLGGPRLSM